MNRKAHTACQNCSGRRQNLSSGAFRSKIPFGSGLGQTKKSQNSPSEKVRNMQKNPAEIERFQPDLVGVSGFEPEASWSRRLVGYFWRAFRGISAPFCSEFFTTSFFLVRIILLIIPRLGHGLGQGRKTAAQNLRRCKQRIAAFSHCCQRHSASGSFCVYAKIRRINT